MYDSNTQSASNTSLSQGSYASEQLQNNPARRNSSSTSLGISEELAFIKREVASLKEQVWNRANNDFLPSEDCSIQNSFTDAQPDQSYNEERGFRNKSDKGSPYSSNYVSRPLSVAQAPNTVQQSDAGVKSSDTSPYASEIEKNNQCEVTLGNAGPQDGVGLDKETLYNGVIVDSNTALEGNMYVVSTISNGIEDGEYRHRRDAVSQYNPLVILKTEIDPNSNGLTEICFKPLTLGSENKMSLLSQNNAKSKFKELVAAGGHADERKRVIFTDISQRISTDDEEQSSQKEHDLLIRNNRMLEEENNAEEPENQRGYNPLLKKTLSVIFSTNESIESTPPQSLVRRAGQEIYEEPGTIKLLQNDTKDSRYTCESIKIENNEDRTVEDSYVIPGSEEKRSSKDIQITTESTGTILVTEGISSLGSEETFLGLVYLTKLQNKNNKGLEDKLNRIADLHAKQIEKYEKTIQMLNEKNEKYVKGNDLLVKTLKTCEKEIDTLALNNQTLHKNLLMFEEDMNKKKAKERQLVESNTVKQKEIEKLREDLKKKDNEIEEVKKRTGSSNVKVESAQAYAKSCEDSIAAIDQTLRRILTDKGGFKMPLIIISKTLESIFAETSKFVGKVERSATVPSATLETESKSPSKKENARFYTSIGTEDTISTLDYRDRSNQSNSAKKNRSRTPDTHSIATSPKGRGPRSMKTLPESPVSSNNENKGLMQRPVTANSHQRSVSNNIRRSFDHRRSSEKEGGLKESLVLKPSAQNILRRESVSTSPCSRTPENIKKPKTPVKMGPELDKVKENLRRKVLSHVSPNSIKK